MFSVSIFVELGMSFIWYCG